MHRPYPPNRRLRDGGGRYWISTSDMALGDAGILADVRAPASSSAVNRAWTGCADQPGEFDLD